MAFETETTEFDWYLPCKFEHDDHGGVKDLLAYYMVFNMTLAPNNLFTKLDDVIKKDINLISLKLSIDNAFLEYKAIEAGMDYIPKID
jgi:hypothetical protein